MHIHSHPFFPSAASQPISYFKEEHPMSLLKNRTVLGVICIVLALVICFGLTPLFNQSVSQKTTVIRVVKHIKAGDEITRDMLQTVEVGGYNMPEAVIKQQDAALGKYAVADLSPGDYILTTKLSDTPASENAYLYNLNGDKQAISVSIKNFAGGLSGKLISGDIVSVIAPDYKKQGMTVIPPELTYMEVIGVTASTGYDTDTGEQSEDENEKQLPATVTLLASPEQTKILAELEADGKLHLSLVYRGSKEAAAKFTELQDKLIKALHPQPASHPAQSTAPAAPTASDTPTVPETPVQEVGGE